MSTSYVMYGQNENIKDEDGDVKEIAIKIRQESTDYGGKWIAKVKDLPEDVEEVVFELFS